MSPRSILISYAGYPYTLSSLIPDNGLANLAGALIEAGHETLILDFGTIDSIRKLYPERLSKKAIPVSKKIFNRMREGKKLALKDVFSLFYLNWQLEQAQKRERYKIASEILQRVSEYKPNFIGFKLWNGDGFSGSIQIAEEIKKMYPDLKIFAGGPHVDMFRETIYRATDVFDALVYAEGEEIIAQLAKYSAGRGTLSDIPNLIFKENGRIQTTETKRIEDLDELPFPIYDEEIYPAMKGDQKIKIIVLDESRGCPYGCYFCIQPVKSGNKIRMKSAKRIIEEMKQMGDNYKVASFRYAGSSTPSKLARQVADLIINQGLKVEYTTFGHIKTANPENFEILKESGCYSIFFGIESGSREILDKSFGKRITRQQIIDVITSCKETGIYTVGSIIFPAPFDNGRTRKESLDLLLEVKPDSVPVQFPGIYPQTEWARCPERFNFVLDKNTYAERVMDYKIKLLFPPKFWKPLPYKVNGKSFRRFSQETMDFIESLEENGILTAITDDLALMAKYAGQKDNEKEFRDVIRQHFISGNSQKIEGLVKRINNSIKGLVS